MGGKKNRLLPVWPLVSRAKTKRFQDWLSWQRRRLWGGRPRKLRYTFRTGWGRFWFRHPRSKRAGQFSLSILTVIVGLMAVKLWFAAHQIIVDNHSAVALQEDVDPNLLNREGDGRVNLLLIGIGGEGHQGGDLSDSIMIASLDPVTNRLTMLSFPRDIYLPINGYGSAKINAAHAYGEEYKYPGGGPKLLADTITGTFGIPIHYYLRVDFTGFKEAIDAVGGVQVDVKKAINDSSYPTDNLDGYQTFKLKPGPQQLDSATALKYVRSRYGSSDFDRADRQQQLLLALKDKVFSAGTLLDPIRINRLISIAAGHVRTTLSVDDGMKLLDLIKKVDNRQVTRSNLDSSEHNLLVSRIIDGSWVLTPTSGDFTAIKEYLRSLMPDGYIKREAAKVRIVNASGQDGLASQVAHTLKTYGYEVSSIGTHPGGTLEHGEIIDYTNNSKIYTLHYLKKRFHLAVHSGGRAANQTEDITIVLGADYEQSANY